MLTRSLALRATTLLLVAATLASTPCAQSGTDWIQINAAASPPRRVGAPFAYEAPEHVVLMFGGAGAAAGSTYPTGSETWEYDGRHWSLLTPATVPPPRAFMAMAYDEARERMVMFGGRQSGVSMNDTWEWDGNNWHQVTTIHSPPVQSGHSMTYDTVRGEVVLFSGDAALPETWLYDGTDWTLAQPAHVPPGRSRSALVWDRLRSRVVMFGGTPNLDDTWEWDGTDWTEPMPATRPPGRSEHAMAYDAGRGRTVLFGGIVNTATVNDTWEWDGTDWTQRLTVSSPSSRDGHGMAYDPDRGVVALFGGSNDTWEYGPDQPGSYQRFGQGCAGPAGAPTLDAFEGLRPYVGEVFAVEVRGLGAGPALLAFGASHATWGNVALPLDLGNLGFPGCTLLVGLDVTASLTPQNGHAEFALPIPPVAGLVGQRFYQQVVQFDTLPTPTGLSLSNAAAARIGAL